MTGNHARLHRRQDVATHNTRVDNWMKIAKPVIPGPNVDLILLPHNSDNTLNYDASGAFCRCRPQRHGARP